MGQKKKKELKHRPVTLRTAKLYDPELYSVMGSVNHLQYRLNIRPFVEHYHWTKLPR